jgi:hypothetical protein
VNQSVAHTEVIASFRRAQAAVESAAKAAKRRDSYVKKLNALLAPLG